MRILAVENGRIIAKDYMFDEEIIIKAPPPQQIGTVYIYIYIILIVL